MTRRRTGPYLIGNPSDEEQYLLELPNRARAEPVQEANRFIDAWEGQSPLEFWQVLEFFDVDLGELLRQFQKLKPRAAPLAFNASLQKAARIHSMDMATNRFQEHLGSDGSNVIDRAGLSGYRDYTILEENLFAFGESAFHVHGAFEVSWGSSPDGDSLGGMQDPPANRQRRHDTGLREIGIGVVFAKSVDKSEAGATDEETETVVGPWVVTEVLGSRREEPPLITGVVYFDIDGNGAYDMGEGLGGVKINAPGAEYFGLTSRSGGYALPVPGNGDYELTFSGPMLPDIVEVVRIEKQRNVKLDYLLAYHQPVLILKDKADLDRPIELIIEGLRAATGYELRSWLLQSIGRLEQSEVDGSYLRSGISTGETTGPEISPTSSGGAYRLVMPDPNLDEFLEVKAPLFPGANSRLSFVSRLGYATRNQIAAVQVTTDDGQTWQNVWQRAGSGVSEPLSYVEEEISLEEFDGRAIRLRFAFLFNQGAFFSQIGDKFGWIIDKITFVETDKGLHQPVHALPATDQCLFEPEDAGRYFLQVRASVRDRHFPFGPGIKVAVR